MDRCVSISRYSTTVLHVFVMRDGHKRGGPPGGGMVGVVGGRKGRGERKRVEDGEAVEGRGKTDWGFGGGAREGWHRERGERE